MDAHGCVAHLSQALSYHPEEVKHDPNSTQWHIQLGNQLQYPLNVLRNYGTVKTRATQLPPIFPHVASQGKIVGKTNSQQIFALIIVEKTQVLLMQLRRTPLCSCNP